jgi:hypothetical protein
MKRLLTLAFRLGFFRLGIFFNKIDDNARQVLFGSHFDTFQAWVSNQQAAPSRRDVFTIRSTQKHVGAFQMP